MEFLKKEVHNKLSQTTQETEEDLHKTITSWVEPLLSALGESEWGDSYFIITSDLSETGEEGGWIVRELAGNRHYHVAIGSEGFFIRTGGETVFSEGVTKEILEKVLREAWQFGPTHLKPPGRR